uniref:Protein RFT1 homolog n=1 Tax=Hyaloperonospora arabidopsidis (strain Emoy2) TaxID=559515 RepID=M4BEC0_HYAAE
MASIFVFRDGFRLAFLRLPSIDTKSTDMKHFHLQQVVNAAWLSTAITWILAGLLLLGTTLGTSSETVDHDEAVSSYSVVFAMYCGAAMIESLAEPMFLLAHASVLVSWQVAAQSAAFLVRAAVQYVGVVVLKLDLMAYGLAELSYAVTVAPDDQTSNAIVNGLSFWRQSLPDRLVVSAFVVSLVVTATSQCLLIRSGTDKPPALVSHVLHVAVGAVCFAGTALTLVIKEQRLLRDQVAAFKGQSKSHSD